MDKVIALQLGGIVKHSERFHALKEYAEYRINQNLKQLETEVSEIEIRKLQGAIRELRRFKTLDIEAEKNALRD